MLYHESFELASRLKTPVLFGVIAYSFVKFLSHFIFYPDLAVSRVISGIAMVASIFLLTRLNLSARTSAFVLPLTLVLIEIVTVLLTGGDHLVYMFLIGTGLLSLMYVDIRGLFIKMAATLCTVMLLLIVLDLRLSCPDADISAEMFSLLGTFMVYILIFLLGNFSIAVISGIQRNAADSALSDRLELESALIQLRDDNLAKTRFLAHISHEVRTPLNAILGIAQIELNFNDLPPRTADALERLNVSGNELLGIINDILDLAKIETGKMELNRAEYDLSTLISDITNINVMRIGAKPIEFVVDICNDLPSHLFGDELRIKQILNNLLSNAIKYTESGQVKLSISHAASGGKTELTLTVEDTGQGIKPEDLSKLFREYFRFNTEINVATEGTGLGLSISKRLAEAMNGTITAESEYGKGSKFVATIVQDTVECPPIGAYRAKQLREFTFVSRRRDSKISFRHKMPYGSVLVVDDVEVNLYVANGLLAPYELKIETSTSGEDTLNKIRSGKVYDIIFIDHLMPDMDGIETAEKLREMGYKGAIVALTANALAGNADLFMKNGFDGFISKPIDARQLDSILNKFVLDRGRPDASTEEIKAITRAIIGDAKIAMKQAVLRDAKKAVVTLRKAIEEENLKLIIIIAHGMKTGLAAIDSHEISRMAAELEEAAKNGNTDFIAAKTETFIEALESLT